MASVMPSVSIAGSNAAGGTSGTPRLAGGIVLPRTQIGQVTPRETLAATARSVSKQQAQVAAYNTVLPVWYGTARQGARVVDLGVHGGRLVLFAAWGRGPHDALVSLTIGDAAPPASVLATHYDGTQVAADPTLAALYGAGYAEVLPGISYSVIRVAAGEGAGIPNCAAIWRGRRVYDPRNDATAWSANRALWLADFVVNATYGAGREIDWDSVSDAADACDELVGGQPRRSGGGLVLDTRQEIADWIETLRTYAGCAVIDEGAPVKLIPNRPRAPVFAFRHSDGNIISMAPVRSARLADVPTVVEIQWTDTTQLPWRQRSAFAPANGLPAAGKGFRLQSVSLPAIHDASQAAREAVERLNQQTLCELGTEIEVFAEGARIEPGDRVTVDWPPLGFADKEFLVTSRRGALGEYRLALLETDPAMYSDAIVAESTTPDTALPNPSAPPAVAGLSLLEEVYQLDTGNYASRIVASWANPEWPYPYEVLVEVLASGTPIHSARVRGAIARSPALQEGVAYTVKVALIGSGIYVGATVSAAITAQGKQLPPSDVPAINAFEAGGRVYAAWQPAIDIDIWRYEVRYGTTGWDAAKLIDRVDALRLTSDQIPVGTWTLYVKALDSVGQYSANAAAVVVTVTTDANAFLIDTVDQVAPTLTNMVAYRRDRTDPHTYYVTEDGVSLATKMPGDLATYTDDLATYHAAVTSTWLGEAHDFGQVLGGQWTGEAAIVDISGTHVSSFGFSTDGSTWSYVAGLSQKANARFARLKHEAAGTATLRVTVPGQRFRIDAIPREEVGVGTSSAAGPVTITLANDYVAVKKLTITPEGVTARSATYDAIALGDPTTFDVYVFDVAGNKIASPFRYQFQGV